MHAGEAAGEAERAHAYVIACFGDPGLHAARERAAGEDGDAPAKGGHGGAVSLEGSHAR